jgi:PEP-CTERM motif
MKVVRLLVALSFAGLFAQVAAAQTDPQIGLGPRGSISESCGATFDDTDICALSGGTVTATLSQGETGGTVDFGNDMGDVTSLTITDMNPGANVPAGSVFSCENPPDAYFAMGAMTGPDSCTFTGMGIIPDDLPSGAEAGIELSGFVANSTIELSFTVPEPSSMLLLGIGLLSILAIGKRRWITRCEA